jgi:hypothetical protein
MTTFASQTIHETPLEVAQLPITRDLHEAEAALDEALVRHGQAAARPSSAPAAKPGVSPFLGQDALMRLLKSQQAMLEAGGELARVHGRLQRDRD